MTKSNYLKELEKRIKKEITFNDLSMLTQCLIIIGICSFVGVFILSFNIYELEGELKQVPHKVCVNETILEEIYLICSSKIDDVSCCKRGVYDSKGNEAIESLNNKTCIIEKKKEVCEIK